jgi:hypothetical protein
VAAQCLTAPTPQAENTMQLLAYLSGAVRCLKQAREIVQRYG